MSSFAPSKTLRGINLICLGSQVNSFALVGDFNHWNPASHPMKRMPDGAWLLLVEKPHGNHRYAFLIDGNQTLDPRAQRITLDEQNERVSLLPVS